MEFELFDVQAYRSLSDSELEQRRLDAISEIENVDSKFSLDELEADVTRCLDEINRRSRAASLRSADMSAVLGGAGNPIARTKSNVESVQEDILATVEYERAFMNYIQRGVPIPDEYRQAPQYLQIRSGETTTTTDASAVIPTTLMNQILTKAETYGDIWAKVRKMNVQGGVEFPIMELKPVATWIGETGVSEYQKLEADEKITFNYYQLECRLARTLLAGIVTLPMFNAKFVELATEAMVRALEQGVVRGDGNGKMLGVTNDTRIPEANVIDMSVNDMTWADWHKKVKAKMKKSYRNGTFVMAQGTWDAYIDGMVDDNGQPVARINYGINGEETYVFMGKQVMIVEDDIFPDFDSAEDEEAFCIFIDFNNYVVNSNLAMRMDQWHDYETNKDKWRAILVCDGKLLDANGVLVIKKEGL